MASDITLAVGDGARRMTYAELAAVRVISRLSAQRLVRRKNWPRQVGNDGVVRVLVPLTEARKVASTRRVASSGRPPRKVAADAPDIRGIIREIIREIAAAAPANDGDDDDGEAIGTLQCVVEGRDRTIAAHEATIRDLRQRLDAEVEERRRLRERLTALLTHRQTGSVPPVPRPETIVSASRVPWWKRWLM